MKVEGLTILILEDEPIIGLVLEGRLKDWGAFPILVHTIEAALAIVEREKVDVAILDVNLHGAKSYAVARALKEKGAPFLFATGYGDALHPAEFKDVITLTKPYMVSELETALEAAVPAPPEPV